MTESSPRLMTTERGLFLAASVYFVWNVRRYVGFLIDDAYISLRYARNWVEGYGLVFNPTEVVEGYTNFLWTALGALGLWLGADGMLWWKAISALSSIALLIVIARLTRDTLGSRDVVMVSPLLFLFGLEAFGYWVTTGMETLFYALLFNSAIWLALRESIEQRTLRSTFLFVALALTRPEGVMVFGLVHGAIWLTQERRIATVARHVRDGVMFSVAYGAYFLWRYHYYGRLFPNTYYAKVTGGPEQWTNGLINLKQWAASQPIFALALVLPAMLFIHAEHRRIFRRLMAIWLICAAYIGYVVSVGGDFMPFFRFYLPVIPLLAIMTVALITAWLPNPRHRVAVAALLLTAQGVSGLLDEQTYRAFVAHRTTVVGQDVGRYFKETLEPGQWMGVNTVGSLPYESRLPTIDGLGLTDAAIAQHPIYVISPLWSAHRRGWGEYMRRRRPQAIVWYNSAGLGEPHYLGDRQLADDPYFRFFYQRQAQRLPARDPGRILERFWGSPFGEPAHGHSSSHSPELGLEFEVKQGFLTSTNVRESDIELIYFALRNDAEVLWPMIDEEAPQSVERFLDRVVEYWRQQPRDFDLEKRAQAEALCEAARQAHAQGDLSTAKRLLSQAAALNREARSALVPQYVANIAVAENDLLLAVQAQREALRLKPDSVLYRRNLSSLLSTSYDAFSRAETP